jgi:hypothetical protein
MQSVALAFRCLCCFLRLPSCIGGFAGARCLDWQGPFRVDWCRWCSAVCFCVDKVCLHVSLNFSLASPPSFDLIRSWCGIIFAVGWPTGRATLLTIKRSNMFWEDLEGWSKSMWVKGQNVPSRLGRLVISRRRLVYQCVVLCKLCVHFVAGRLVAYCVNNWLLPEMIRSISTLRVYPNLFWTPAACLEVRIYYKLDHELPAANRYCQTSLVMEFSWLNC